MNKCFVGIILLALLSSCYAGGKNPSYITPNQQSINVNGNSTQYNQIVAYNSTACIIAKKYSNNNLPNSSIFCKQGSQWLLLVDSIIQNKEIQTAIDDNNNLYAVYINEDSKLSIKIWNIISNTSKIFTSNVELSAKNLYDLQLQIIDNQLYIAYVSYNPDRLILQKYDPKSNSLQNIKQFSNVDIVEGHNVSLLKAGSDIYLFYPDTSGSYSIFSIDNNKNNISNLSEIIDLSINSTPLKMLHDSQNVYLILLDQDKKNLKISKIEQIQSTLIGQLPLGNYLTPELFTANLNNGIINIAFINPESDNALHYLQYQIDNNSWKTIFNVSTISSSNIEFINNNLILVSQDLLDSTKINVEEFSS
jgi:hypothetical protein